MNRFEAIKNMTLEEMADFLCNIRSKKPSLFPCTDCTAENTCRAGKNGFIDWLNEVSDDGRS